MSAVLKYLGPYQEAQLYNGRKVKRNEDITVTSGEAASLIAGQPGSWEVIEGYEPPEGGKKPSLLGFVGYASVYDAHTMYPVGSVVEYERGLYLSLTTTEGEAPSSNPTAWKSLGVGGANAVFASYPELLISGSITRAASGAALAASVTWPDGATGAYAGTESTTISGAVDSYTVTHVLGGILHTYTQPKLTRNSEGVVTERPAITVA